MSRSDVENLVRRTANRFGVDIHRHRPESSEAGRLTRMLSCHCVDVVLDVGANTGQFAQSLRKAGYQGRTVSFEPLSTAHAELIRASHSDPRWEIAPRAAIGDHDGEIEMHVAGNSVSSSALNMLDSHAKAAPASAYVDIERVRLASMDTISRAYLHPDSIAFLKVDTQGYEDRVLDGATELLSALTGVQLELSLVSLYDGQQLFDTLVERMRSIGYSIWAIWPGFQHPESGRMLQVDVTFFRD